MDEFWSHTLVIHVSEASVGLLYPRDREYDIASPDTLGVLGKFSVSVHPFYLCR